MKMTAVNYIPKAATGRKKMSRSKYSRMAHQFLNSKHQMVRIDAYDTGEKPDTMKVAFRLAIRQENLPIKLKSRKDKIYLIKN